MDGMAQIYVGRSRTHVNSDQMSKHVDISLNVVDVSS
jgi:hypothetical protein